MLAYILKALLGLCFNSLLFSFITDVTVLILRKSYIFKISLVILAYCCCTVHHLTRFSVETEKTDIKSDKSSLTIE